MGLRVGEDVDATVAVAVDEAVAVGEAVGVGTPPNVAEDAWAGPRPNCWRGNAPSVHSDEPPPLRPANAAEK